jgi:hypothetical protein
MQAPALAVMTAAAFLAAVTWPRSSLAAEATCEFRKEGDTKPGRTGPCDVVERPGYVDIALRNGDTFNLRPTGKKAGHYKDTNGNSVVRTSHGHKVEFKWPNKKIVVTPRQGAPHAPATTVPH